MDDLFLDASAPLGPLAIIAELKVRILNETSLPNFAVLPWNAMMMLSHRFNVTHLHVKDCSRWSYRTLLLKFYGIKRAKRPSVTTIRDSIGSFLL